MEVTRSQAVQLLNETKLCGDFNQQCTYMTQLTELVVRKEPKLLREFLPELTIMQVDPSPGVRKSLATFMGEACAADPSPHTVAQAAACLQSLLQDRSVGVVKQAILAVHVVVRTGLAMLGAQPTNADVMSTWEVVRAMQAVAGGSALQAQRNDSVRISATKLLESVSLMFTAGSAPQLPGKAHAGRPPPKLPQAAALSLEADSHVQSLVALTRQQMTLQVSNSAAAASQQLLSGAAADAAAASSGGPSASSSYVPRASGPLLIVLIKALSTLAVARPSLVGKVLPALLTLANEGGLKATGSADDDGSLRGSEVSVGNTLRHALVTVLRSRTDTSVPWRDRLVASLNAIGAQDAAESSLKFIQRAEYKENRALRDGKRAKLSSDRDRPEATPTPPPPAAAPLPAAAAPAPAPAPEAPPPPLTSSEDLSQLLQILAVMVTSGDGSMLDSFITNLPPPVFADLVIANMINLPSAPPPPSAQAPSTSYAASSAPGQPGMMGPPTGLQGQPPARTSTPPIPPYPMGQGPPHMHRAQTPPVSDPGRHTPPPPPPPPPSASPPPAGAATAKGQAPSAAQAAGPLPGQRHLGMSLPRISNSLKVSRHLAKGLTAIPPELAASGAVVAPIKYLAPRGAASSSARQYLTSHPMQTSERSAMREAAVGRLLALKHVPQVEALRELVLAKLATQSPDDLGQSLLDHILETWEAQKGFDLALRWLHCLFVSHCGVGRMGRKRKAAQAATARTSAPEVKMKKEEAVGDPMAVDSKHTNGGEGADVKLNTRTGSNADGDADGDADRDGVSVSVDVNLSGTPYEDVLLALLERLRENNLPADMRALLGETPALPVPGVVNFLEDLVATGGDWATAALGSARTAIQERPPAREAMLHLVLRASQDPDASTRSKAIRLLCNQLYPDPMLSAAIVTFASDSMKQLLQPPHDAEQGTAGGAKAAEAAKDAAPQQQWNAQDAIRFSGLHMSLCSLQHSLLEGLLTVYIASPPAVQSALTSQSGSLVRALGAANPTFIEMVRNPPAGSEELVQHMLEELMDGTLPTELLKAACKQRFQTSGDIKVMAPIVVVLSQSEVKSLLPQLLQMADANLKTLYRKLATPQMLAGQQVEPMFGAAELLVALHCIEPQRDGVPLKSIMASVDTALRSPDIFPQAVIAQAVQQMEGCVPLPPLFMRTVISALKQAPRLRTFVADLLSRLISKQVWLDKAQWRGFLMLVENSERAFLHVMLQLPAPVLDRCINPQSAQDAALRRPAALRLAQFAASPDNPVQVLRPVQSMLDAVLESERLREQQQQQQQQAAPAAVVQDAAAGKGAPVETGAKA